MKGLFRKLHVDPTDSVAIQLYRYTFIGSIAFYIDLGLLFLLTSVFGLYYVLSASIAFSVGLVINYIISIKWIFNTHTLNNKALEFWIFAGVGVLGLVLNAAIIFTFTHYVGLYYMTSKLISTAIIYTFNFGVRKYFLFS